MGTLLDFTTLKYKVNEWLEPASGFETSERAFQALMVSSILDVSEEEARDAVVDGGNDRGVDAAFVDEREGRNNIHLFQFKYTGKFENTRKNYPGNSVDKMLSFISDVLDKDKSLIDSANPILKDKIQEIWDALSKRQPRIEVHFCGNMKELAPDVKKRVDTTLSKFRYVKTHHHTLDSIIDYFIERERPRIDREMKIVDKDYFERTDGSARALICSVDASEIIKLIADPDDEKSVYRPIFDENVRVYLSHSNPINKEIIETALSKDRHYFWYLNNGLTITCDSFSYAKGTRSPLVSLKNIQIVNGGQTSNALFEASQTDSSKTDEVLVLVRIIEAKVEEIGRKGLKRLTVRRQSRVVICGPTPWFKEMLNMHFVRKVCTTRERKINLRGRQELVG